MSLSSTAEKALNYFPGPARALSERLLRSDVGVRLARGALWNGVAGVSIRIITLAGPILVARCLGKEQFGEFGMLSGTVGMFVTVCCFGMGTTATKYIAQLRGNEPERAGIVIGLTSIFTVFSGLAVSGGLFLAAPCIADHILAAPHLAFQLRIGALGLILGGVNGAQTGTLLGLEAFQTNALIGIINAVATSVATVVGAWGWGLSGAVLGSVAPSGLAFAMNVLAVRRHAGQYGIKINYREIRNESGALWSFSLPAFLSSFLVAPALWASMAMVANTPGGYAELGVFNAVNQWYLAILFIPGLLSSGLLPVLSERLSNCDCLSVKKVVHRYMLCIAAVVAVPSILLSIASSSILRLYGADYSGEGALLVVSILTAALLAVMTPIGYVIAASGRMWAGFWMNAGWAGVFLAGAILFRGYGCWSIVLARAVAYLVHSVWTFSYAQKIFSEKPIR